MTGEALSTAKHRACVRRGSRNGREWKKDMEEYHLTREMRDLNNRVRLRLGQATAVGACLTVVPDLLRGTTLSAEEFQDNLRIRFGLVTLALRLTCDGYVEKISVDHAL